MSPFDLGFEHLRIDVPHSVECDLSDLSVTVTWCPDDLFDLATPAYDVRHEHLAMDAIRNDPHAAENGADAVHVLAPEIAKHLRAFADLVVARHPRGTFEVEGVRAALSLEAVDSVLLLDRVAAEYLEKLGEYGALKAKQMRQKSQKAWRRFVEDGESCSETALRLWTKPASASSSFARALAWVLWRDVIKPRLDERKRPAVSLSVVERLQRVFWEPGRMIHESSDGLVIVDRRGAAVARVPTGYVAPTLPLDLAAGLHVSHGLVGQRLVRLLVALAYTQDQSGMREPSVVEIVGGLEGLKRLLGLSGGKASTELRQTLQLLQHAHIMLPHGEQGGLLTWSRQGQAAGRPAVLRIRLGDPLMPGYVTGLSKSTRTQREARMLVPIPLALVPMVGRARDHSAQAALQMSFLVELRKHAPELVDEGAVAVPDTAWQRMADAVGLPSRLVGDVKARWLEGGEDAPAFITMPRPGAFTLAVPSYQRELDTLVEAGVAQIRAKRRALRRRGRKA